MDADLTEAHDWELVTTGNNDYGWCFSDNNCYSYCVRRYQQTFTVSGKCGDWFKCLCTYWTQGKW